MGEPSGDGAKVTQATDSVGRKGDAQADRLRLMFDPWLSTSHRAVSAICGNLIWAMEERSAEGRQRKRKARDKENLEAIIRAIAANLAHAVAAEVNPPSVAVSLRGARMALTRYDRKGFSALPDVLALLDGALFTLHRSTRKGVASTITALPSFAELLQRFRWRGDHFGEVPGRETIWLSRTEHDYVEDTKTVELIDYAETEETTGLRQEMVLINAALADADLAMEPDAGPKILTTVGRSLRRQFKLLPEDHAERFDRSGRLFGGWWQSLSRDRRTSLRIDGEPIADLDFANMFMRLAYIEAGHAPPDGDLYSTVPGLSEARWRPGVKLLVNAMLFRTGPLTRLPKGATELLPRGMTGAAARQAVLAAHPTLAPVFEAGAGFRIMNAESRILVAALLGLADRKIAALPMHDGLMVARSKADKAAQIMKEAAQSTVGYKLPISLKSFI